MRLSWIVHARMHVFAYVTLSVLWMKLSSFIKLQSTTRLAQKWYNLISLSMWGKQYIAWMFFFLTNNIYTCITSKIPYKDQTTYRYILDGSRGQLSHQTNCTKVLRKYKKLHSRPCWNPCTPDPAAVSRRRRSSRTAATNHRSTGTPLLQSFQKSRSRRSSPRASWSHRWRTIGRGHAPSSGDPGDRSIGDDCRRPEGDRSAPPQWRI
jgi:hypothetical protein